MPGLGRCELVRGVLAKLNDWLAAAYRKENETVTWGTADEFSGGDILPGFRLPVAEIFAD